MKRQTFFLVHPTARSRAAEAVTRAPDGYMVVISEPTKKRIQEERYHAMLNDIAEQCAAMNQRWDAEDWKRLLVDDFAKEMRESGTPLHNDGRVIPSLDGRRVVQLGIQTRDFYVREASAFIEYLFAYGANNDVVWSDPARVPDEVCA